MSFLWAAAERRTLLGFSVFLFEDRDDRLQVFREQLSRAKSIFPVAPAQVSAFYSHKEFVLVPGKYHNPDVSPAMISLLYGEKEQALVKDEYVPVEGAFLAFRIPQSDWELLREIFPEIQIRHSALSPLQRRQSGDHLHCVVVHDAVKVWLRKNGELQILQQFTYRNPEDVTYQLLNICQQYQMDPEKTPLRVSGMLIRDSSLYNQLYTYFLDIDFYQPEETAERTEALKNLPGHFFTHLTELLACAS